MTAPRLHGFPSPTGSSLGRKLSQDALRGLALRGAQAAGFECRAGDVEMRRMRLFDVDTYCMIRLNADEMLRRTNVGLDPITDYGALRLLSSLPLGHPVPLLELPEYELGLARALARGAVTITGTHITRRLRPVLAVLVVVVVDDDWQRGIKRAGRFSNFASRMLVCTSDAVPADAVAEATFYGVGLATIGDAARCEMAAHPEPTDAPFDPVVWQFQEEMAWQL